MITILPSRFFKNLVSYFSYIVGNRNITTDIFTDIQKNAIYYKKVVALQLIR